MKISSNKKQSIFRAKQKRRSDVALFYSHKAKNSELPHHKRQSYIPHHRKAPHIKQKRPKSPRKRTVSGDVGRFLFSKATPQTRRGQGGDADAPYAEISQERMGVLSRRLWTEEI